MIMLAISFAVLRAVLSAVWSMFCALFGAIQRNEQRREKRIARLEKEQERQAAALAKEERERKAADERLAKAVYALNKKVEQAYYRIEKAEDEIARFSSVLEQQEEAKEKAEAELADVRRSLALIDDWSCTDPRTDKGMEFFNKYPDVDSFFEARTAYERLVGRDKKGNLLTPEKAQEKLEKREAALVKQIVMLDGRIFTADQRIKKAQHEKYVAVMDKAFCEERLGA